MAGAFGWGKWAQSAKAISLDLYVDAATSAADVAVSIDAGFLVVAIDAEPLLSGLLAQPVLAQEVTWALEDEPGNPAEGIADRRVLYIEIPKKEAIDTSASGVPGLFDSLRVDGAECAAPGLVDGAYYEEEGWLR